METELRFEQGTLILTGCSQLPRELAGYFRFDKRQAVYRAPAHHYSEVINKLRGLLAENNAPAYQRISYKAAITFEAALTRQQHLLLADWQAAQARGILALPANQRAPLALAALKWAGYSSLIVVANQDQLYQWQAWLTLAFPDLALTLLNSDSAMINFDNVLMPAVTIATYDQAALHMDAIGNRFNLLIFDEVTQLNNRFYQPVATAALASYRLAFINPALEPAPSAKVSPEIVAMVGELIEFEAPNNNDVATISTQQLIIELSEQERAQYRTALATRDQFLTAQQLTLTNHTHLRQFILQASHNQVAAAAMQAHQLIHQLNLAISAQLRAINMILCQHYQQQMIIYCDESLAQTISTTFLIPNLSAAITRSERQQIIAAFCQQQYRVLIVSANRLAELQTQLINSTAAVRVVIMLAGTMINREILAKCHALFSAQAIATQTAMLYQLQLGNNETSANQSTTSTLTVESSQLSLFSLFDNGGESR